MDISIAKNILNTLYQDIQGYDLSFSARKKLSVYDRGLTYGEIVPESFYEMVKLAEPQSGEVFYDLGSGSGKAVFAAALLFPFSKVVGVEVLDDLYEAAQHVKERYNKMIRDHFVDRPTADVQFFHEDFLEHDLSHADIIFAHATCFHDGQIKLLLPKLENLKKGSRILLVSKTIASPSFHLIKYDDFPFSWGKAALHLYRKNV